MRIEIENTESKDAPSRMVLMGLCCMRAGIHQTHDSVVCALETAGMINSNGIRDRGRSAKQKIFDVRPARTHECGMCAAGAPPNPRAPVAAAQGARTRVH